MLFISGVFFLKKEQKMSITAKQLCGVVSVLQIFEHFISITNIQEHTSTYL